MSEVALFIVGCAITVLVVFAIGGLMYAARLDGKYQKEMAARSDGAPPDDS